MSGIGHPFPRLPVSDNHDVPNPRTECLHVTGLPEPEVAPTSRGCQECRAEGTQLWVHLRLCLTCGHVGCCDSSPYKHADVHFAQTEHPVMRSFEPGETWRWCYVDRRLV
jgi:CPA1 family monovalent cation:H+ antiporter